MVLHTYKTIIPESKGNFFNKSDFNSLCKIDMNQKGSFKEFYNLLRSLSHDEHKNAFFITERGQKVYIKIEVEKREK